MASAPTGLNPPGTRDPLQRMHVTRPKSAKGRTRTTPQGLSHNVETYQCSTSPTSLTPRPPSARSQSGPRMGPDEVPELLHQLPYRPPSSSLNRYRVLPSIGVAGGHEQHMEEELIQQTSAMKLATESGKRPSAKALYRSQSGGDQPESGHTHFKTMDSTTPPDSQEPSEEPRLLLAIRTHTGQRFERHFRPTDTLYTVLAAVGKIDVPYEDCIVESMEVPRRSFLDLSRTLQECGIPNKSVLCIQHLERD
ncbi:UBX domain-containing protein 10 [Hyperolius riggenbachi]|uniref:UBX domain-containing protein 10 n=1 Tax=Hyperolius riggenbachi TaxID=752182 RepID=UPI0035A30F5D